MGKQITLNQISRKVRQRSQAAPNNSRSDFPREQVEHIDSRKVRTDREKISGSNRCKNQRSISPL